jgi:hypothetical protein
MEVPYCLTFSINLSFLRIGNRNTVSSNFTSYSSFPQNRREFAQTCVKKIRQRSILNVLALHFVEYIRESKKIRN